MTLLPATSPISTPVYPGSPAHGAAYKPVTVIRVDHGTRIALVRDSFGKMMPVRCDIMRAKGNMPLPGEQWLIDRQYGDWVFGAILNGGTDGVIIPPESVTGLNDTLAVADTRVTNVANDSLTRDNALGTRASTLETNTVNAATAKGDLLAATAPNTLTRLPVGSTNQVAVVDPAAATGLAYKTVAGQPSNLTGMTGAVAASRFVGGTVTGAPTTGTFLKGDWVKSQDGHIWICTFAGTPGTWFSQTDAAISAIGTNTTNIANNNAAIINLIRNGNHAWHGSGSVAHNTNVGLTGYPDNYQNGGLAALSGGLFLVQKVGWWNIRARCTSSLNTTGYSQLFMTWTSGAWAVNPADGSARQNVGAFVNAGLMWQSCEYTGWVTAAQAANGIGLFVYQTNAGSAAATYDYYMEMNFMGGT